MAHALMLEQPVLIRTKPALHVDDEQFFQLCQANRDLQLERTAEGDLLIMAPEAGSSGATTTHLIITLGMWAERDGRGRVFGPSTGFKLPNGAVRAPDVSWVRQQRIAALSDREWQRFLPLCPDFVLELRSPSDSLPALQRKMQEYLQNGAELGWLLDPVTKSAHIYRPSAPIVVDDHSPVLSGAPLLSDFVLDLRKTWAAMEQR